MSNASYNNVTGVYDELTTNVLQNITQNSANCTRENDCSMLISPWIVYSYLAIVLSLGILANIAVIVSVLKQKLNGILCLILQLSITDAISCAIVYLEIWSINKKGWTFNDELCPVFLGLEIFTGTLTIYLLVSLNLHTISTWNLNMDSVKKFLKDNNNPLTKDIHYSEQALISRNEPGISSRTMNIDYRHKKSSLSIISPTIIVWIVSASLSLPEFALSNTVFTSNGDSFCTLVDIQQRMLLQSLLALFKIILPNVLLFLTLLSLVVKLCQKEKIRLIENQNNTHKSKVQMKRILWHSIFLSITFLIFSVGRQLFVLMHIKMAESSVEIIDKFKMPPLENLALTPKLNLTFSMLYYTLLVIRPFLYFIFLSKSNFPKFIVQMLRHVKSN